MAQKEFKYIKGAYEQGMPADICFYCDVESWNCEDFLWEFHYLENYVMPSVIRIHINSSGGRVVDGMSVFAAIQNSKYPTQTINDGIAASMGSIIWAAGREMFMKDYALLMIHNPFFETGASDENTKTAIEAFKNQISTIYQKRFGMSEEDVKEIMDGKEGVDGTWMTAQQAIERGFIDQLHIIETPEAVRQRIAAAVDGVKNVKAISLVMNSESEIWNKTEKYIVEPKNDQMTEKDIKAFADQVGMTDGEITEEKVSARLSELMKAESEAKASAKELLEVKNELQTAKADLEKVNIELTGAKTSAENLKNDLQAAKDELQKYRDAETEALNKSIEEKVDAAIAECKIGKEDRETWIEMFNSNFELAEKTLATIPAREDLSKKLNTPENKEDAEKGMKSEEEKVKEVVDSTVGKNFKFRKLS